MNPSEYERIELPAGLTDRLAVLPAAGLAGCPSLPQFVLLAYMFDRLVRTDDGRERVKRGKLVAAYGAICETGGVVAQTTNGHPTEVLERVVGPTLVSGSFAKFWQDASRATSGMFERYSDAFNAEPPGLLPFYVATAYRNLGVDYPNDTEGIKRHHDVTIDFVDEYRNATSYAHSAFATGMALATNHPDTFKGKHGVYTEDAHGPGIAEFKHSQSATNAIIGTRYHLDQLRLCREWALRFQPEAERFFVEPTHE